MKAETRLNPFVLPDVDGQAPTRTIRAADITPEVINWLWRERVPLGMVSVFGGFPGVGKSTILYDLAARTSREGKQVLIATAEDHLAAVIRPRLEAAGADLERVSIVTGDVTLPEDIPMLAQLVREHEAKLLVLDPLVAFISDGVNTHRDHHVRRVLAPLGEMAEATGVALVVVIHTNKGASTDPLMRISGSIGFTGAARCVLVAADDPKDEDRRIFAVVKSNLAELPTPVAYRLEGVDLGNGIHTSHVAWLGDAPDVDVRDLLALPDRGRRLQRDEAEEFLRDAGVLTAARPAAELKAEAEEQGINYRTLRRAREALGVPKWQADFHGGWWWGPKDSDTGDTHRGHTTESVLSPVELPAETPTETHTGDSSSMAGEPSLGDPVTPCTGCGHPEWFHFISMEGKRETCRRVRCRCTAFQEAFADA